MTAAKAASWLVLGIVVVACATLVPTIALAGPTTTTVTSSVNPSLVGQVVTFTATVTGNSPTGTVTFTGAGNPVTASLTGGTAQFTTSALAAGNHNINATYNGDANNSSSTSPALMQSVQKANTTTTVTSSVNPSLVGQVVTFTATVTGNSPTGTVTFTGAGNPVTASLTGGTAQFTTSALAAGNHNINATYNGDANNSSSTSPALMQSVQKANTTTTVTSSVNPSLVGQVVTFTATVTGNSPTGTVTFTGAGNPVTASLTGGTAQFTTSALAAGNHNINATYNGDANNSSSTSPALMQSVQKANTTTTVTSSVNPSLVGQVVTFTATVTGNSPTGTVTFTGAGNPVTASLTGGTAQFTTSALAAGNHNINATYNGDANNSSSTSPALMQSVNASGAATHFSVSAPATATSSVAFNFTVTALDQFNNVVTGYTGTVHFTSTDAQATLPANATLTNGVGTFSATLKTAGTRIITATDTVNASITGTSSPITVSGSAAHFSVSAPATATSSVAFNFTVTALDQFNNVVTGYTGTVHFTSTDAQATLPANATLTNGVGTFSATLKTAGTRIITATDTVNASITGTSSPITVSGSAAHFSVSAPATATSSVAFNFTVTALDQFNNVVTGYTGTVHFTSTDAQATLPANATLTNGVGTFSATLKTAGNQTITATDTVNAAIIGTSNTIGVGQKASTTTTLASSLNPSAFGQAVTFTATVIGNAPTGTITFLDGGTQIGSAALSAGKATFATSALAVGSHAITARYGGDANNVASTSAALTQTVNTAADSVKLREMQVSTMPIVAQISGQAITTAASQAVAAGFSGNPNTLTPNGTGFIYYFNGDPQGPNSTPASDPDGVKNFLAAPDGRNKRFDDDFSALGYAGPTKAPPLGPAQPPRQWLAWIDFQGTDYDRPTFDDDLKGTQVNVIAGLTYRVTSDFLVGVLGGYEYFDYSSLALTARLKGDGWTTGGYVGWRLAPQVLFDGMVGWTDLGANDTAGAAAGNFTGNRLLTSGRVTGTYPWKWFVLEPSAQVYALWERDNPFTDSLGTQQPANDFSTGRVSGGMKVIYPWAWSSAMNLAPYVGLYGDYYFSSEQTSTVGLTTIPLLQGWSARTTGGVVVLFNSGARLDVGAEFGGIGLNTQIWTFTARGNVPFALGGVGPAFAPLSK